MNNETTQELQIIDPKEYGLEEVKATEMTSGLNSIIEERTALESIFNDVILKELNADTLKEARELRLKIQKNRTQGIDVWHKTNKEFYLAGGRFVDAVKNREIAINSRLESKLGEIENHFKALEEQRLNNLYTERVALLEPYGEVNKFVDLKQMDDTTFNNFLSDTKLAFETRKENERKAEEQRIADEKNAEEERLKKEQEEKAEQERIKAENEKLRLENEAKEKQLEKERRAQAEKDRLAKIESDRLAKIQADKDAELDLVKKELEAEKQRKEKELEDEKARIEAEESEKLAKDKAALLAPDKEKINALFIAIRDFSFPEVKTEEANKIVSDVKESFEFLLKAIKEQAKTLK